MTLGSLHAWIPPDLSNARASLSKKPCLIVGNLQKLREREREREREVLYRCSACPTNFQQGMHELFSLANLSLVK